jgi:hypothetical protein
VKKVLALGVVVAFAAALSLALLATADDGKGGLRSGGDGPLTMAVYGDAPYGTTPTDTAEFAATPAFITAVNRDNKVKLVLHVGDIHSGKQFCTFSYDQSIYALWSQFKDPLVYTPGDNEWADCHKSGEGGNVTSGGALVDYANGDPVANLGLIRQIFFSDPGRTLGDHSQRVVSQAQSFDPAHPDDAQFVENVMWEQSNVLFVSVNIPGGSNNDADIWYGAATASGEQTQEATLRTAADLRWLDAAFAQAESDHVAGVVIQTQADMWDLDGKASAHIANYEPFISEIATRTASFGKPVLLFNGDSHVFRSDNPLVKGAPCLAEPSSGAAATTCADDDWANHPFYNVSNFHRIVVHGSTFPLDYLRVSVNTNHPPAPGPSSFGPFSWERVQP